jgi:hypothetical protein
MSANDALEQAAAQHKESAAVKMGNIHEASRGEVVDRPTTSTHDFDSEKFEQQYGLPSGYLAGVTDLAEANNGLRLYFGDDFAAAHETAVNNLRIGSTIGDLQSRVQSHFDNWSSERYGTSAQPLTAAQQAEREKLGSVVTAHMSAHARSGADKTPTINQIMNLARVHVDPDFRPTFRKPTGTNIHNTVY